MEEKILALYSCGMSQRDIAEQIRELYDAAQRIQKHWHARCQNWDLVRSQLQLMFADRVAHCALSL